MKFRHLLAGLATLLVPSLACAQTPSQIIISSAITQQAGGAGALAPTVPGGAFNIGPYWWVADANGVFSYRCRDTANPTPLETCAYPANDNPSWNFQVFAGQTVNSFGQAAKANDGLVYIASYSNSKGGALAGIYAVEWSVPLPDPTTSIFPIMGAQLLANQNLHGNGPTAIALDLVANTGYVGFLKNANLVRIDLANTLANAPETAVGGIPGARSIYALAFAGGKLYAASDIGLYVFGATSDITKCTGNAADCGTPQSVQASGAINCVVSDGNSLYYVTGGGVLYRLNVLTGIRTKLDAGLRIEAGHTSACAVDGDHNLLVGEQQVAADITNKGTGRLYLAANLALQP